MSDSNAHIAPLEDLTMVSCLHQFFEQQVARTPEAIALIDEAARLTYAELNARANQLAHHLQRLGVGPEVPVGICVERSLEAVVGLLSILKAGGAYVPLDPAYPAQHLAFMLEDAAVRYVLTQERLIELLPWRGVKVVCLDADRALFAQESDQDLVVPITPEHAAYVMYTSGSTGTPKGVVGLHRGAMNRFQWMWKKYPFAPYEVCSQKTALSFVDSVWEIFGPLLYGIPLLIVRDDIVKDPYQLVQYLAAHHVSRITLVPSLLRGILDVIVQSQERLPDLKFWVSSGESLLPSLARRFSELLPDALLINLYGSSEVAADVTWHEVGQIDSRSTSVPIGQPIENTQIYAFDQHLNPVPGGISGELYVGGANVARGYLNRPELTAEKFVPDPFGLEPGGRLYRTGDLTRYRPDGTIEYLGRIDHQVKVRGYRIELGAVEAVLREQAGVRHAVVMAREDSPGDTRLVGYVVADQHHPPTVSQLRRGLAARLPDYMVPSTFVLLETLPLTPNGKVNRRALPAPDPSRPELEQAYVAPRTPLEKFLARLWCEVLKLDKVGIHDNFFDLGGNSIKGAMFINNLQQHLKEPIFIVALFDSPTVAALAAFLTTSYGDAVSHILGPEAHTRNAPPQGAAALARAQCVDAGMLEHMRQLIVPVAPHAQGEERQRQKNPPAIFILAPPRSGTTLLRVMLAGHPQLFAAAELQLLGFNTLGERRAAFAGKYSLWLEGAIRAVMQIHGCDADQAKRILGRYEDQDMTTKQFYRVLQDWLAPQTLVDKSPSYALDLETLKRAEDEFANALYIHMVRHPYAMVRSFERYHLEQVFFMPEHPFSARELGELVWVVSHQNIVEFLGGVPEERQYRMHFEDLTRQPQTVMEQMCRQLGLEYHPDLIEPYKDKEKKMTDGIYAASAPMGDMKFNEYQGIDAKVAESWKEVIRDNFLGEVTWEWAERLGYERVGRQAALSSGGRPKSDDSMEKLNAGKKRLKQLYQRRRRPRENGTGAQDE
jgi:amino acid adenylation domain-containing protein